MESKYTSHNPTVTHVLQHDGQLLGVLLEKINVLKELNHILAQCLEDKLVGRCEVASYENFNLTAITHSAIWATQFRFQAPEIIKKLQKFNQFRYLKNVQCKIVPQTTFPAKPKVKPMLKLSADTAEQILDSAKTIQYDKLRMVMEKIARNNVKL
jgi:hypothetical protein